MRTPANKLIVSILLFIGGCIVTPAKSPNYQSHLFGTEADKTYRVGVANRDAIYARFGKPPYSTQHDLACGYLFGVTTGEAKGLLWGPCMPYFGSTELSEIDDTWLEFDSRGVLKRVATHLVDRCWGDEEKAWRNFAKEVPDQIRPEQMLDGRAVISQIGDAIPAN